MLKIYNTLTKQKEVFTPLFAGKVGMYSCGPTVYGKIHIGNLRAYLLADTLRRYFEYAGYEVRSIKNITDVGHLTADDVAQGDSGDDKMIKQALAEKKTPQEIAAFYEDYFHRTETALNILPAHYFPRATGHIPQMIVLIQDLIAKKFAYEKNGNVFLDVTAFPRYGALSGNTLARLKVGARLKEHPDKKNPWDFALWLKAPANHLMKWESPWSLGYPGWHIECSAMSMEYLGDSFDIHTGGEDNIFPHHEAEIVQSEGVTGKPFVRYWLHNRHLLADGVKMSKSKGNLYTLEDILDKGFSAMDVRLLLLSSHYRSQMNFTWDALTQARANWETLQNFHRRLEEYITSCHCERSETPVFASEAKQSHPNNTGIIAIARQIATVGLFSPQQNSLPRKDEKILFDTKNYRADFDTALEDDLNTPQCLTILFDFIKNGNKLIDAGELENPTEALQFLTQSIGVLGLRPTPQEAIPHAIQQLAAQRKKAREDKNFVLADSLREQIEAKGFTLEDTPSGMKIKEKNLSPISLQK